MRSVFAEGRGGGLVFLTHFAGRRMFDGISRVRRDFPLGVIDDFRLRLAPSFDARAIVVTDVERRHPGAETELAKAIDTWRALNPLLPVLNAPPTPMRRYELLRTLYERGINQANIYRLDDPAAIDQVRFPCFVRDENGHNIGGPVPTLLHSRDELCRFLQTLATERIGRMGLVIIEYEDTSDATGLFPKYSYFKVGAALVPAHRFVGTQWYVKEFDRSLAESRKDLIDLEREFLENAPYETEIAEIFDIAGIEYGRVDFGMTQDQKLHVFEINTNPNHPVQTGVADTRQASVSLVQNALLDAFGALIEWQDATRLKWPRDGYFKSAQNTLRGLLGD